MHVSYAEMARAAHEVLRMLGGSSYGVAAEAVEGLMLTHAAFGKAYALTRLARIAPPGAWRPALDDREPGVLRVDLAGAPLVLYGGLLADAFAAKARAAAFRMIVTGTNGGWAAPYIVRRAARHGLTLQGLWSPPELGSSDEAPATRMLARSASDETPILVEMAPVEPSGPKDALVLWSGPASLPPDVGTAATIDFEASVRDAMARGFEVDEAEHRRDYTAIAALIRVAFSERSRAQAG